MDMNQKKIDNTKIADIEKMAQAIETDEIKETPDGRKVGFKNGEIVFSLYDHNKDGKYDAIDINQADGIKTYIDTDGNGIADKLEIYEYEEGRVTKTKIDSDENGVFEEVHNNTLDDNFKSYVNSIEYQNNETGQIYAKDNLIENTNRVESREEDIDGDGIMDKKTQYSYITSKSLESCKETQNQDSGISSQNIIRSEVGISYIDKDGDGKYETMSFE